MQCSVDTVVCVEWHPLERNQIVTCGKGHVSFWSLDNGGMLYKRMGVFESRDKPRYVTCVAFNQNGDVLTGDSNGNIIVWARGIFHLQFFTQNTQKNNNSSQSNCFIFTFLGTNTISRLVKNVHEGSIFALCVLKDGNIVTGGGKDGRILYFDSMLNPTGDEAHVHIKTNITIFWKFF